MHKQAAVASAMTNPGKVIDQDKRIKANKNVPTTNELSRPVNLRPEALQVLQAVAMSFLESSFNRELCSAMTCSDDNLALNVFFSGGPLSPNSFLRIIISRYKNAKSQHQRGRQDTISIPIKIFLRIFS